MLFNFCKANTFGNGELSMVNGLTKFPILVLVIKLANRVLLTIDYDHSRQSVSGSNEFINGFNIITAALVALSHLRSHAIDYPLYFLVGIYSLACGYFG